MRTRRAGAERFTGPTGDCYTTPMKNCLWICALLPLAVCGGTNLWHYAQMDFELYRLEAMHDESRRVGMSADHPGRIPAFRKGCRFRIRCAETAQPPFTLAHAAKAQWKDGYLVVSSYEGWRDVGALRSPVRGWEAQTFDGVWRPAAVYPGGETPPHRDDLPEDRAFAGLVATNGYYDAGAETLAFVECASPAEPRLFVGESLPELAEEDLSRLEYFPRMRQVADGRWRTETALAFRYLRFKGTGVSGVKAVPVGRPMEEVGTFASPNPRHVRLREVGVRTTRLCALDFLVDGLKRDRMPWGGDLAVSLLADAYVFGDAEIVRRSLSVLDAYEGDVNGIVTYSMWLIVSHDLYQRYFGDRAFLDARWWRVKGRIEDLLSRTDERGFVVKGLDWVFIDWAGPRSHTALQAIWAGALDAAARLADRVRDARAADYRAVAARVRANLNAVAWDEARGLYRANPDATPVFARQANIYAVVFGVADAAKARRIGAELVKDDLPPVGTPYVYGWELVALNRAGFHAAFLSGLEKTFGAMLDAGATTFWEGFDATAQGDAQYAFYGRKWGKSLCHAWSAWPAFLFVSEAMGVKPTVDGWASHEMKPIPGAEGMRATIPTPHGPLAVSVPAP